MSPLPLWSPEGEMRKDGVLTGVVSINRQDVDYSESSEKDLSPTTGHQGRLLGGGDPEAATQRTS